MNVMMSRDRNMGDLIDGFMYQKEGSRVNVSFDVSELMEQ